MAAPNRRIIGKKRPASEAGLPQREEEAKLASPTGATLDDASVGCIVLALGAGNFLNFRATCSIVRASVTSNVAARGLCRWCLKYHSWPDTLRLCSWCAHMSRSGATCPAIAYRMYAFHDMTRVLSSSSEEQFTVLKRIGPFRRNTVCDAALPLLAQAGFTIEEQVLSRVVPLDVSHLGEDPVAFHRSRHRAHAFITAAEAHRVYPFRHCGRYNYVCAPWLLAIFGLVMDPWNVQSYPDVDRIFEDGNCFKVLDRACNQSSGARPVVINYEPTDRCDDIEDMITSYGAVLRDPDRRCRHMLCTLHH
eukprot:gnl/TRDRNA2_/TRDRNA2_206438_c0_seq1.p1 gnl/TRDRNA2_/TRDRNA2_206438_c0~~gnl/TRDRNA2_/TRDRNA2_206438_c0_seq1.p1  ORF type:complete len:306 (+),score=10.62 gnl/TRDRNA2_/TRDRNA2_206438_c0_seq1:64-981(+)